MGRCVPSVEPKPFRVLPLLVRNPGKLIPKWEILHAAVTEKYPARTVAVRGRS
jgi:hypothetical protein